MSYCQSAESSTSIPAPMLVMEIASGGSLNKLLYASKRPIVWKLALRIAMDVASGCAYLHERGIIHRDIKPENVLLVRSESSLDPDSTCAKVCDFGVSKLTAMTSQCTKAVGTPLYMAPEMFSTKYSSAVDIWSFGLLYYELIARCRRFEDIKNDPNQFGGISRFNLLVDELK